MGLPQWRHPLFLIIFVSPDKPFALNMYSDSSLGRKKINMVLREIGPC
jgi:hypothetical protein